MIILLLVGHVIGLEKGGFHVSHKHIPARIPATRRITMHPSRDSVRLSFTKTCEVESLCEALANDAGISAMFAVIVCLPFEQEPQGASTVIGGL